MAGSHFTAKSREPPAHSFGHQRIVDNAGLLDPESGDSDYLRLMLSDLFWPEAPECNPIRAAPIFQSCEARHFLLAYRYDQLPTSPIGNALFGAEAVQGFHSRATGAGLNGAWLVIET
jgi:hypothetical protein